VRQRSLLSVGQAAKALRVSPSTVRRLCLSGDISCVQNPKNRYREISAPSVWALQSRLSEPNNGPKEFPILTRKRPGQSPEVAIDEWVRAQGTDQPIKLTERDLQAWIADPRRTSKKKED
jgi:hypothetical protein